MSFGEEAMYEAKADYAYDEYKLMHGIWTTKDGREVPIREMTDSHLANTIRLLRRSGIVPSDRESGEWLEMMLGEMERRRVKAVKR